MSARPGPDVPPSRTPLLMAAGYAVVLLVALRLPGVLPWPLETLAARYLQYLPLTVLAAREFLRSGRLADDPALRRALRTIGWAIAGLAAGMGLYLWVHEVHQTPYGLANPGDPVYLTAYAVLMLGLMRLPRAHVGHWHRWTLLFDALTITLAAGFLIWAFVLGPTLDQAKPFLDLVVTIAYPLFGLGLILTLNAVLLGGGAATHRPAFRRLALAVVLYVLADSLYQLAYYGPAVHLAEPVSEVAYVGAYLVLAWAGRTYRTGTTRSVPAVLAQHPTTPLPLVATATVALLLLVQAIHSWDRAISPYAIGLVGLTVLLQFRQARTARENRALLAERNAQESEARLVAMMRHASDLTLVVDGAWRISFASPSAATVLGVPSSTLLGRSLADLIHPEDFSAGAALVGRRTSGGETTTIAWRMRHHGGEWRPMETVATDLRHEPAVGGIVLATRDLTERTLLEAQLRQAQKMEVVGRLAGGVAHDFNNLLTTVLASTEILLDDRGEADPAHHDLITIRQAATRAAALTGQLLAFSRQQVLAPRPFDAALLVDETVRMLQRLVGTGIRFEVHAAPQLTLLLGDPNQVAQILLNLAVNARDAMPGGGTIRITLRPATLRAPLESRYLSAAPGEYLVLEVADTGSGMDDATRERLFEPFFTTKPAGKGTGLGLATTLSITEQHRGGITVTSAPGVGTRIAIWLPATARPAGQENAPIADLPHTSPGGRERILLVEDEAPLRDVARRILERLGYEVEAAADAEQARRVVATTGVPQLMLTDVIMPGESGPQLAEALRRQHPSLRILFMSGYTGDELGRLGVQSGELAFLQKPFTPKELAERVRGVLDAPIPGG